MVTRGVTRTVYTIHSAESAKSGTQTQTIEEETQRRGKTRRCVLSGVVLARVLSSPWE